MRTKRTRTIAYSGKTEESREDVAVQMAYASQPDPIGCMILDVAKNRVKQHKGSAALAAGQESAKALWGNCKKIMELVEMTVEEAETALKVASVLAIREPKTDVSLYFDEAEMRMIALINDHNIFSSTASALLLLWSLDRTYSGECKSNHQSICAPVF